MIRRSAALVITLVLAASACASGTDDAAPATAITDPPPTVAITDAPSTTTAPTVATTTSTTSTTAAPTTTIDPIAEIEAAVQQAVLDRENAFFAAASDPTDQDARESYRATHAPGKFAARAAFLDELLANGTTVRSSTSVKKSTTFPTRIEVLAEDRVAIQVCRLDSDVIRIPESNTTPELIIDDRVVTTLARSEYLLIDGRWVLDGGALIERWEGPNTCGA